MPGLTTRREPLQDAARRRLSLLFPNIGPWARAALFHGLVEDDVPTSELADEVPVICRQRLAPLMISYLNTHSVRVPLKARKQLQESSFSWSAHSHFVLRNADSAMRTLEAAGIPFAVSKGPGIAQTYPSLLQRPFSDVDVLVSRSDFQTSRAVLRGLGFSESPANRQPWPYFDRWCREGINLMAEPGGSVDLHHHVPPWFWSRALLTDDLVCRAEPTTVYGVDLPCLTPEDNLLIAGLHVVSDRNHPGATLMVWRDLLQLLSASAQTVAASRARAVGLSEWMAAVFRAFPADLRPEDFIAQLTAHEQRIRGPWRVQGVLSAQVLRLGPKASQIARLPLVHGAAFAAGMLVPSRNFVRTKFPEERAPYRRWWSGALRSAR